jgi:hypothetical protein
MTPRSATDFYRIRYTKPAESDKRYNVMCEPDDPDVLKAVFELTASSGYHHDVDFDLDARDELGKRVQRYRIDEIKDLLDKMFEAGVAEGTRRVRETLREVIGL